MPDNLTISISADSGKARADIELLKAQLRAAQKEARDFAKAGAEAGDKFPSAQLTAAAGRVGALDAQLKSLNRTTAQTSSVMDALATKSMRRLLTQFDSVGKSAQNIAMVMGGVTGSFAGGFLAASVFKGISTLNEQLNAVSENIKKINEEARKTGQRPLAVQAGQEIAAGQGRPAEALSGFMGGVAEAAAKAQVAAPVAASGVKVLGNAMTDAAHSAETLGSMMSKFGVKEMRGSAPLTLNLADVYTQLGVSMKNVTGTGDTMLKKTKEVAQAFLAQQKSFNPLQLNEMAKALNFTSAEEALKLLPGLIAEIDKKIAELNKSARGATQERSDALDAMNAAMNRVQTIFKENTAGFSDWRTAINTGFNNWLADFLEKTLPAWFANTKKAFADFWPQLQKDFADSIALWKDALPDFQPWIDKTIAAFQGMWDSIKAAAQSARNTLSSSFPGDPGIPAMPMAGGGIIRGPGTGTSDSILARLSDGEFVMRAAAVNRWGPRFMAALNSLQNPFGYHAGGLVRGYATGGMVTARAADGTTVNLHFPSGSSFALHGDAAIVAGLVREGRRAGMLNAGRLPGAFAA